ncbi:MAG: hypothetical protein U0637_00775 [Phycisphaerales bacterium]
MRSGLSSVMGVSATLFVALAAHAQPDNDNCASATVASLGGNAWDNTDATTDGSGSCGFAGNTGTADVWFRFTPAVSDNYFLDTCSAGSINDTMLGVYDSCGGSEIACNDDFCGLLSRITMAMSAGTTYYIRVAEWAVTPVFGNGTLTITQAPPPPANDNCANAIPVTVGASVSLDTTGATDDGAASCGFGGSPGHHDVWYSFTAPSAGCFAFSTCNGTLDTIVSVFDGCGGSEIACDDDFCGFASSSTARAVLTNGQHVLVRVAGWGTLDEGPTTLDVTQGVVPANDLCANAIALNVGIPVAFDNSCAGTEGASSCGFGGDPGANDIWYTFTAPAAGPYRIDTCQSNGLDTQLGAYDSCGGSEVACNDDACGLSSAITVNAAAAGQMFVIRLAGWGGTQGQGIINVTVPPPNDTCAGAIPVTVGTTAFDTTAASNDDATNCGGSGPEVFYSFTPAASGGYTIDTFGSGFDTILAVVASDCTTELACNDDSGSLQSMLSIGLTAGTTYIIQVDGFGGASGAGSLNISGPIAGPANDLCENATPATVGSNPFNNQFAGTDGSASCGTGGSTGSADVWFSFTAPATQDYRLDTCGSFDTLLSVQDSCGGSELACNDDTCGLSSALTLSATAGTTYRIRVASWAAGVTGSGSLTITSLVSAGTYTVCDAGDAFQDISATGTLAGTISGCDDCFEQIPVGFTFHFYGASYTDVFASSNGLVAFGSGSAVYFNVPIPTAGAPDNFTAAFWDDLNPGAQGDVYYETTGSAGSRTLTISWQGVTQYALTTNENFQVVLHEGSDNIEFRYGSITPDVGGDYTAGTEDATGLFGTAVNTTDLGSGNLSKTLVPPNGSCPSQCDSIDFNGDTLFPDVQDIFDFIFVFAGGACPTGTCHDLDFNNDGLIPDSMDISALISVFGGGPCIH